MLDIVERISSEIAKNLYAENYMWENKRCETKNITAMSEEIIP